MAALLLSCTKENGDGYLDGDEATGPGQFTAYFSDRSFGTKVSMDTEANLFWNSKEDISVWGSQKMEHYSASPKEGALAATFKKVDDGNNATGHPYDRYYAVYPYSSDFSAVRKGVFSIALPAVQKYIPGSFDTAACPLMAATKDMEDTNLKFKKACGFIRLAFNGDCRILSLSIKASAGETICGEALLSLSDAGDPHLTMKSGGSEISIDCGEGIALERDRDTYVWVAVPPILLEKGFTVTADADDGRTYIARNETSLKIERNAYHKAQPTTLPDGIGTDLLKFGFKLDDGRFADAIDIAGPTITACVPRGADVKKLVAEFRTTGSEVRIGDAVQVSGKTVNDFSQAKTYTVISSTGESKSFTVNVIDIDLPAIYVSTPAHAAVKDKVNWIKESRFIVVEPDGTVTNFGNTGIRGRGNSSWNYKKKPYAIKFETRPQKQEQPIETLLGMPGHKRWCLLSNCMGYYFGNIIGYEVGRRSAIEWSPHARFVELILNGEHKGLYTLVEQIKIDKCRIPIKEMDANDLDADHITGGYLLTYDTTMDERYQFRSASYNMPVMIKSPDDDDMQNAQFEYIRNYVNEMELSLSDPKRFAARDYLNYLDPDTFIGAWMTKEMAGRKSSGTGTTTDFVTPRSTYFYKDRGGVMKAGPCWDFDVHFLLHQPQMFCMKCQYYGALFKDPQFVKRVKELWPEFKSNMLGNDKFTGITDYVDSLYNASAYSAARDAKLWGKIWSSSYPTYTVEEQRDRAKGDLSERLKFMDEQINAL